MGMRGLVSCVPLRDWVFDGSFFRFAFTVSGPFDEVETWFEAVGKGGGSLVWETVPTLTLVCDVRGVSREDNVLRRLQNSYFFVPVHLLGGHFTFIAGSVGI